jgi:hypothetical protein
MSDSQATWCVEYRDFQDGREYQSPHSKSRELAVDLACDLMRQHHSISRVVGPRGEVVELPEIERRYQELLAAGRLI